MKFVQILSLGEIKEQRNNVIYKGKGTGSGHPPGGRGLPMERKCDPEAVEVNAISLQKGQ